MKTTWFNVTDLVDVLYINLGSKGWAYDLYLQSVSGYLLASLLKKMTCVEMNGLSAENK